MTDSPAKRSNHDKRLASAGFEFKLVKCIFSLFDTYSLLVQAAVSDNAPSGAENQHPVEYSLHFTLRSLKRRLYCGLLLGTVKVL